MKKLLLLIAFITLSTVCVAKDITVTLTVYYSNGNGSDSYSRRGISASGAMLREGRSVAIDPRLFPYGTILYIEGVGKRVCEDTGSAVIKRTASRKRGLSYPVVDLYFEDRCDALEFAREHSYAKVRVIRRG